MSNHNKMNSNNEKGNPDASAWEVPEKYQNLAKNKESFEETVNKSQKINEAIGRNEQVSNGDVGGDFNYKKSIRDSINEIFDDPNNGHKSGKHIDLTQKKAGQYLKAQEKANEEKKRAERVNFFLKEMQQDIAEKRDLGDIFGLLDVSGKRAKENIQGYINIYKNAEERSAALTHKHDNPTTLTKVTNIIPFVKKRREKKYNEQIAFNDSAKGAMVKYAADNKVLYLDHPELRNE